MTQIQLPDELTRYVQERAAKLGYKDPSEYLAMIVEADKFRRFQEEIEDMLEEAIVSPSSPLTDGDFDDIRREGLEIIKKRQSK